MKDLQDLTITLMVYEPVNEQAYDEPSAVPYVCEVQFYWPECGCVATVGGVCAVELATLLYFDSEYKGQKLVVSVDEAIEAGDAQCIDRLAEAMVYVIGMLIKQEREDG